MAERHITRHGNTCWGVQALKQPAHMSSIQLSPILDTTAIQNVLQNHTQGLRRPVVNYESGAT